LKEERITKDESAHLLKTSKNSKQDVLHEEISTDIVSSSSQPQSQSQPPYQQRSEKLKKAETLKRWLTLNAKTSRNFLREMQMEEMRERTKHEKVKERERYV
jgi:hypothetical protein